MRGAIISFGTGGTLGHRTLVRSLAQQLRPKAEVVIISEERLYYESDPHMEGVEIVQLEQQPHRTSTAGAIDYPLAEVIADTCSKRDVGFTVFSTLFDARLVRQLRNGGIRAYRVSYPLRDSHETLFRSRGFADLFTRSYTLADLSSYPAGMPESVQNPVRQAEAVPQGYALLTIGGGARPSADFLREAASPLAKLLREHDTELLVVSGPKGQRLRSSAYRSVTYSNRLPAQMREARLVVSEAGYFTVHELIVSGTVGVVVPGARRIDNQELRGALYERLGLGACVLPEEGMDALLERVHHTLLEPQLAERALAARSYLDWYARYPTAGERILEDAGP